ncbi:leucine-rich repeat, immunoglobulin-like domain and transmembrane domain-containing protein 1 isoform X2 [Bufo gargarizans]|uniref:leucine-rich repeat, immunoglobulin-like domain and transmembrane domain-containing protein 1 isoform X2 n=1 Tax=Bufo gargarizans TaxID=30331 RepID=UPI001CF286A0|nr:leucine-rich repeat, immunoglobulin-like domain and transmembrane domain-containing protein 1 isoform X2 [Bufo gargarizans]
MGQAHNEDRTGDSGGAPQCDSLALSSRSLCPPIMSGPHLFWLVLLGVLARISAEDPCTCIFLEQEADWSLLASDHCCVNLTLSVNTLDWNLFTPLHSLRVLDLSNSGIEELTESEGGRNQTLIEILYMDHNHLMELPEGFLSNAPNLRILHLEFNELRHLPPNFLQVSVLIQELHLSYNNLHSFPASLLRPSLTTFGFLNNSLDCSCALYDQLEPNFLANGTRLLLDDVVCAFPKDANGQRILDVPRTSVCRSHGLTVALICIPLVALVLLVCWYVCCRRQKGAYANTRRECSLVTVDRNGAGNRGEYHHYEPRHNFQKERKEQEIQQFKDPILLRPSAALLGSNRDLYEEVEIKPGTSADSLVEGGGREGLEGAGLMLAVAEEEEEELGPEEPEVETVSVTEVMKDSSDREKLYLNQTTDYYSLVPEIELEDSDHCEYESVDLT